MMVGVWWLVAILCPAVLRGQPCLNCESYVADNLIREPSQMLEENMVTRGGEVGQACGARNPCAPGLDCHYAAALDTVGVCREIKGVPCVVFNETYQSGETFMVDCRTQCTCQEPEEPILDWEKQVISEEVQLDDKNNLSRNPSSEYQDCSEYNDYDTNARISEEDSTFERLSELNIKDAEGSEDEYESCASEVVSQASRCWSADSKATRSSGSSKKFVCPKPFKMEAPSAIQRRRMQMEIDRTNEKILKKLQAVKPEGRYACASLCPKESISPMPSSCRHPRLVEVPGHCCREWMCDSHSAERPPPECSYTAWSGCSSECGTGLSRRAGGAGCGEEVRLCQHRLCPGPQQPSPSSVRRRASRHRLRKGHECKATQRKNEGVRLLFASCLSRRKYRPKECGSCPGYICRPELSTSLRVPVLCQEPGDSLEDATLGADLWASRELTGSYTHPLTVSVEWISKCECLPDGLVTTRSPELLLHRVHRTSAP